MSNVDDRGMLGGPEDKICNPDPIKQPEVGDHVIFVDPTGNDFNALVITRWSNLMINCVRVEDSEDRYDSYGRQIVRPTSVPHISNSPVHGLHWRWPGEKKAEIVQPEAR